MKFKLLTHAPKKKKKTLDVKLSLEPEVCTLRDLMFIGMDEK